MSEQKKQVLFALSALVYFPFSEWVATTRIGTTLFLWGQIFYSIPMLLAFLAVPVLLLGLLFPKTRRQAWLLFPISILFIISCMTGIVISQEVRTKGMQSFAVRSQALVAAIKEYEQEHSVPPQNLSELIPDHLSDVPSTGMMAYPEYRYHAGDEAKEEYFGNAWVLEVFTPGGGINFDKMIYFPEQNYPKRSYGGWLERIGEWAYVHE